MGLCTSEYGDWGRGQAPKSPAALKLGRAWKGMFSPAGLSFVPLDELPNPALQIRPEPRLTLPRGPKSEDPPGAVPTSASAGGE